MTEKKRATQVIRVSENKAQNSFFEQWQKQKKEGGLGSHQISKTMNDTTISDNKGALQLIREMKGGRKKVQEHVKNKNKAEPDSKTLWQKFKEKFSN